MGRTNTNRLHALARQRGSVCEFCGIDLVVVSAIPKRRRVKLTGHYLTYIDGEGKTVRQRFATVEHIQRLADGGTNDWDNLALSCAACNGDRNKIHYEKRRGCRHCGRDFDGEYVIRSGKRCCRDCAERFRKPFQNEPLTQNLGELLSDALKKA